jgi:predicted nicotinamide N-methyase
LPEDSNSLNVIEIGAGCGALSIALAHFLSQSNVNSRIYITDLPEELALIKRNVLDNPGVSSNVYLIPYSLDWCSDTDIKNLKEDCVGQEIDWIIGSDVVYEIQHFELLVSVLTKLASRKTRFIMAMEHRWRDIEADWWDRMKRAGWKWTVVEKAGGEWWSSIVEIDVYIMQKRW